MASLQGTAKPETHRHVELVLKTMAGARHVVGDGMVEGVRGKRGYLLVKVTMGRSQSLIVLQIGEGYDRARIL